MRDKRMGAVRPPIFMSTILFLLLLFLVSVPLDDAFLHRSATKSRVEKHRSRRSESGSKSGSTGTDSSSFRTLQASQAASPNPPMPMPVPSTHLDKEFISSVFDLAEIANLCDNPIDAVVSELSKRRSGVRVRQRTLQDVGARYIIVSYLNKNKERKNVISIRGSRNFQNLQSNLDSKMEEDEYLGIKVHRGYLQIYKSIFNDLLQNCNIDFQSLSVTGHSLGGAVSCLVAAALQKRGLNVEGVKAFGMPKFTDKRGSLALSKLNVCLIEHIRDPICISPGSLPFSDGYVQLAASQRILFVPANPKLTPSEEKKNGAGGAVATTTIFPYFSVPALPSFLSEPLEVLKELNVRGERIAPVSETEEADEKHDVFVNRDAAERIREYDNALADVFAAKLQYHSMGSYVKLLRECYDATDEFAPANGLE